MEVSKYERGVNSPGRRRANRIAEVTGGEVPASSWDQAVTAESTAAAS